MVNFTTRAKKKVTKKKTAKKSKTKKSTKTIERPVMNASVQKKHRGETLDEANKDILLKPIVVIDNMATVGVVIGATKNMKDFESLKINVSLHMRCLDKDIEDKVKFISKKVGKWINQIGKEQGL